MHKAQVNEAIEQWSNLEWDKATTVRAGFVLNILKNLKECQERNFELIEQYETEIEKLKEDYENIVVK